MPCFMFKKLEPVVKYIVVTIVTIVISTSVIIDNVTEKINNVNKGDCKNTIFEINH